MLNGRRSPKKATTLVEVLVALVLLVFGLGGIMELYVNLMHNSARSSRQLRAWNLAQCYLGQMQAMDHAALKQQMAASGQNAENTEIPTLYPQLKRSQIDPDFLWNAGFSQEEVNGIPTIQVKVWTEWRPEISKEEAIAARGETVRKEAVGYVAAP